MAVGDSPHGRIQTAMIGLLSPELTDISVLVLPASGSQGAELFVCGTIGSRSKHQGKPPSLWPLSSAIGSDCRCGRCRVLAPDKDGDVGRLMQVHPAVTFARCKGFFRKLPNQRVIICRLFKSMPMRQRMATRG